MWLWYSCCPWNTGLRHLYLLSLICRWSIPEILKWSNYFYLTKWEKELRMWINFAIYLTTVTMGYWLLWLLFLKKDVNEAYIISIDQLKSSPAKKREEWIGIFFFWLRMSEPWSYGTWLCMFLFSYSDNIIIKNCLFCNYLINKSRSGINIYIWLLNEALDSNKKRINETRFVLVCIPFFGNGKYKRARISYYILSVRKCT